MPLARRASSRAFCEKLRAGLWNWFIEEEKLPA
jgi:hypothetical protein